MHLPKEAERMGSISCGIPTADTHLCDAGKLNGSAADG